MLRWWVPHSDNTLIGSCDGFALANAFTTDRGSAHSAKPSFACGQRAPGRCKLFCNRIGNRLLVFFCLGRGANHLHDVRLGRAPGKRWQVARAASLKHRCQTDGAPVWRISDYPRHSRKRELSCGFTRDRQSKGGLHRRSRWERGVSRNPFGYGAEEPPAF